MNIYSQLLSQHGQEMSTKNGNIQLHDHCVTLSVIEDCDMIYMRGPEQLLSGPCGEILSKVT